VLKHVSFLQQAIVYYLLYTAVGKINGLQNELAWFKTIKHKNRLKTSQRKRIGTIAFQWLSLEDTE
jgi:hypothetical protein